MMQQVACEPSPVPTKHNHNHTRLIILGASNITRGLSTVFETARLRFGPQIEVFAAIGHGRSYGRTSRAFIRTLPGILDCGIWNALQNAPPAPRTIALLTDVGNDIVYGVPPSTLLDWVNKALDRLVEHDAQIVMTSLPMPSIRRVPRWQAQLAKTLIYARKGPTVDETINMAGEVDAGIRDIAKQRNLPLINQPDDWYSFDPIHITRKNWPIAADIMFKPLNTCTNNTRAQTSFTRWRQLRSTRPLTMRLFGITLRCNQPARQFTDGSTFSLY